MKGFILVQKRRSDFDDQFGFTFCVRREGVLENTVLGGEMGRKTSVRVRALCRSFGQGFGMPRKNCETVSVFVVMWLLSSRVSVIYGGGLHLIDSIRRSYFGSCVAEYGWRKSDEHDWVASVRDNERRRRCMVQHASSWLNWTTVWEIEHSIGVNISCLRTDVGTSKIKRIWVGEGRARSLVVHGLSLLDCFPLILCSTSCLLRLITCTVFSCDKMCGIVLVRCRTKSFKTFRGRREPSRSRDLLQQLKRMKSIMRRKPALKSRDRTIEAYDFEYVQQTPRRWLCQRHLGGSSRSGRNVQFAGSPHKTHRAVRTCTVGADCWSKFSSVHSAVERRRPRLCGRETCSFLLSLFVFLETCLLTFYRLVPCKLQRVGIHGFVLSLVKVTFQVAARGWWQLCSVLLESLNTSLTLPVAASSGSSKCKFWSRAYSLRNRLCWWDRRSSWRGRDVVASLVLFAVMDSDRLQSRWFWSG